MIGPPSLDVIILSINNKSIPFMKDATRAVRGNHLEPP
jgi:hypothetical protein